MKNAVWGTITFLVVTTISFGIVAEHIPMNKATMSLPFILGFVAAVHVGKSEFGWAPRPYLVAGLVLFCLGILDGSCDAFGNEGINRINCAGSTVFDYLLKGIDWLIGV